MSSGKGVRDRNVNGRGTRVGGELSAMNARSFEGVGDGVAIRFLLVGGQGVLGFLQRSCGQGC